MEFKVECASCHKEVMLENDDIQERDITIRGHDLVTKVWTCPECHKDHHVELDDVKSKEKFEALKAQGAYNEYRVRTGAALRKSDVDAFDKKSKAVEDVRNSLRKEFKGSFYQWEGNKVKLDFKAPELIRDKKEDVDNVVLDETPLDAPDK